MSQMSERVSILCESGKPIITSVILQGLLHSFLSSTRPTLVLLTLITSQWALADSVVEDRVQPSHYTGTNQYFGQAVDLHHDRVIVGAPFTPDTGDVYIYNRDGHGNWIEETRLLPPSDAQNVKRFGKSVSLIDGYAFVGADAVIKRLGSDLWDRSTEHYGAVFVYRDNGHGQWRYDTRILSPSTVFENYAYSMDAERDGESFRLAVGAPLRKDTQHKRTTGAVYVYTPVIFQAFTTSATHASFTLLPDIPPPVLGADPAADSMQFGHDVDIHGDRVLIGAPGWYDKDGFPSQKGRAYLYEREVIALQPGWYEKQQLQLMGSSRKHQYGHSVALQAERAVVGNPCNDSRGCGEAHVFELLPDRVTFYHAAELEPLNRSPNHYGSSVALNDIRILVGAENGVAYLFKRVDSDYWNPLESWNERSAPIWESEVSSLAINDLFAAVGLRYEEISTADSRDTNTGRVEVRRLQEQLLLPEFHTDCIDEPLVCKLRRLNSNL